MPLKTSLLKELMRIVEMTDIGDLGGKEITIKLINGTEITLKVSLKEDEEPRLKLVEK